MRLIGLAVILTVSLVLAPLGAEAQSTGKVHRIGWLSGTSPAGNSDLIPAFREGLRQLGHVEGKNLGRTERLPVLAVELIGLNVDVLVTPGTPVTIAAKQANATVPIVMVAVGNPVETGSGQTGDPGSNVTGVSGAYGNLAPKWLELLLEVVPKASRIGYLTRRDRARVPEDEGECVMATADARPYYLDDLCPECRAKLDAMLDWIKRQDPPWSLTRPAEEPTTTPEDTLREAGISSGRQARYQRRISTLLRKGGA